MSSIYYWEPIHLFSPEVPDVVQHKRDHVIHNCFQVSSVWNVFEILFGIL